VSVVDNKIAIKAWTTVNNYKERKKIKNLN